MSTERRRTLPPSEEFLRPAVAVTKPAVHAILAAQPELIRSMSEEDKLVLAFAAGDGKVEAVRLKCCSLACRWISGEIRAGRRASAAWYGNWEVVRLLLAHRAPLEEKDTTLRRHAAGLGLSRLGELPDPQAIIPGVAETLIQAGAEFEKPGGSEEVKAVIRKSGAK